jgi:prevent-host-death family protein
MEISAGELRGKPVRIIEEALRGTEIIITVRGKKKARIVPYTSTAASEPDREVSDDIFGLWSDNETAENVDAWIREKRKGRRNDR